MAVTAGRRLLVAGGTVWDEQGGRRADVLVDGETIAAVGNLAGEVGEAEVIEASGLDVLPGFIDFHVHLDDRIGGVEIADDFASGSEIAIRNGITTLMSFATQRPEETLDAAVGRWVARAGGRSHCDVGFHLTPTAWPWDRPEVERLVARGFRTFKLYTTYRPAGLYTDYERLDEAMRALARLGAGLLVHCEDDATLAGIDSASLDLREPFSHTRLRPEAAEVTAIGRVLDSARRAGCRLHVVHVSTADGVALIDAARSRQEVSCETGPHYLLLDDARLAAEDGQGLLCTPPLRSAATRARLEAAAVAGAFDLFATDHCPFRRTDKLAPRPDVRTVPNGLPGLGALVPLVFELLVASHRRPLAELVVRLAANPARVAGLYPRKGVIRPGSDADLVVVDPAGPQRPVVATLADCPDPWHGRTTTLAVRRVVRRGEVVVADGRLVAPDRRGGRVLAAA
ncbi:MAG: D-hydantoinase [Acidobacteria bacterium]|nr:D-hydantoinase [Acidobacteriota bacterium]